MQRPAPRQPSRRLTLQASAVLALLPWLPAARAASAPAGTGQRLKGPPVARVAPVTETFFGTAVTDPYRWMENVQDPAFEPFMRGQDAWARQVLGGIPGRAALARRVAQLSGGVAVASSVQTAGDLVFYQVRPAGANTFQLAVRQGVGGTERILLDPSRLQGEGGVHVSLDWWVASPDGRHVVYGLSPAGSEDSVLHVMEVASQRVLPERIAGTQYAGPSWLPDGSGFFYSRVADLAAKGTTRYYLNGPRLLHRLGTDVATDPVVMVRGHDPAVAVDEKEFPFVLAAQRGDHAVLLVQGGVRRENPIYVARLSDVLAGKPAWTPVCGIADEVVDFALDEQHLYLLSTRGADNGRVLRTPLEAPALASAEPVVPEGPLVIEGIAMARDGLYLRDLDGGYHTVRKLDRQGRLQAVPLPWEGAIEGLSTDARQDGFWCNGTSWLLPYSLFRHDPNAAPERRTRRVALVPPPALNLSGYEVLRLQAKARDGTLVPLSVVQKKGLPRNGRHPTLVQAYGSYQIAINPYFSPRTLAFLERGGVLAVAHVRGGGEYGKRWWKAGQKLNKPNTWRDLIDCCEHLLRERIASPRTLTIQGGSAGGITVGRALTERPDLFAGVISDVGVSNALRAEFGPNGPPNIDEFGTVTEPDGFQGLLAMDAMHHVKDGTRYPAVMLTIGMTDPRVEAWQGAKMAARLQQANRSDQPILLRVNFDAGHGLGSTRAQIDAERADQFAFALWVAGRRSVA